MGTVSKKNLAVLASGSGSNLEALIQAVKCGIINNAQIALVISNKQDAFALIRAQSAGIPAFCIKTDEEIIAKLKEFNTDLVLLAGYLKILSSSFLEAYKSRILNIHPSLLPDFGGMGMYGIKVHEAVIKAGVTESGCTVHLVTEEIDSGPILAQSRVAVLPEDTPKTLAKRVLEQEHLLYSRTVREFIEKNGITN